MSPRPYRMALRDEHAGLTRRRLVDAAIDTFVTLGYAAATIDAIAERAGVSRRTVFSSVGGKAALLKLAFDRTLAGDDQPEPIAARPQWQHAMQQADPRQLLYEWLALNADIAQRIAVLHHVVVIAADADSDAASLLADTDKQRAVGNRALVARLTELDALAPHVDAEQAAAIADTLIDPCIYRRLVQTHRWPFDQYLAYLQTLATTSLLDPRQGTLPDRRNTRRPPAEPPRGRRASREP